MIVQSPEINAFTLPGDTICVDTGLIRALHSAEEMAGVLGHELSHAVNRDPLTMLARNLGMAALLNVISGGQGGAVLANMAQTLVNVHYGREAEDRADAFSVRPARPRGNPPEAFAEALARIRDTAREGARAAEVPRSAFSHRPADRAGPGAGAQADGLPAAARVDWAALVKALPGK